MNVRFARLLGRCLGTALLILGAGAASAATIAGSAHDFSVQGWSGGQICLPCHTPHRANTTVADAPLWNHALSTAVYTLYTSPTLNAVLAQPGGGSKLCLSCHDGTVAINSFGGSTGTNFIGGRDKVGPDMRGEHPIGFTYDTTLATNDGSLKNPATATVTIGAGAQTKTGTIAATVLYGDKLECASCHDVHNTFTNGEKLLKVTSAGSAICITCHSK
ncbi:MAG: cytochrome C [Leptothrix sp. (in: Bacteria)]|nr:cytochrome C [Leptothrix sp. (in: b-proteobacteria)]